MKKPRDHIDALEPK